MNIKDMKRNAKGGNVRYVATVTDDLGSGDYELSIHGPAKLAEQAFEKCNFEATIRPKATAKEAETHASEAWHRHFLSAKAPEDAPGLEVLSKQKIASARSRNSVVISVRRLRGAGTFWAFWFPNLVVPAGSNLFFGLPPVCNCSGTLFPVSGDPDLFLTLNGIAPPTVAASTNGGTAIDSVFFGSAICWPWTEFWPFFRVNGFRSGITNFWMTGFGVFP